jgi:SAM-dependent methyltransferase
MSGRNPEGRLLAAVCALSLAAGFGCFLPAGEACAQQGGKAFAPHVGQAGKDVIWVPTPESTVRAMLDLAKVVPSDYVVDLGSGDGRTVIMAAKNYGARALGVEFNADMVALSRKSAQAAGVADRAQFRRADIFAFDFSSASVVTLYLLPDLNVKLRPKLLQMKPGTRVVSHSFDMGDWPPTRSVDADGRHILLWIVPARVAGRWTLQQSGRSIELEFNQSFSKLGGIARAGNGTFEVSEGAVNGSEISFVIARANGAPAVYRGRIDGRTMEGTVTGAGRADAHWSATSL